MYIIEGLNLIQTVAVCKWQDRMKNIYVWMMNSVLNDRFSILIPAIVNFIHNTRKATSPILYYKSMYCKLFDLTRSRVTFLNDPL